MSTNALRLPAVALAVALTLVGCGSEPETAGPGPHPLRDFYEGAANPTEPEWQGEGTQSQIADIRALHVTPGSGRQ